MDLDIYGLKVGDYVKTTSKFKHDCEMLKPFEGVVAHIYDNKRNCIVVTRKGDREVIDMIYVQKTDANIKFCGTNLFDTIKNKLLPSFKQNKQMLIECKDYEVK